MILFTGEGDQAFCSGGDQRVRGNAGYVGDDGVPRLNVLDLQRLIRSLPKPVIALVAGYAIGGGHVLHLVCDLTIAAENARFGQTGPRVGSFDGGFGSSYLARIVGQKKAREIWYLCEQYDAQEALAMGLVNKVVPLAELEATASAWARRILHAQPARDPLPQGRLQRRLRRAGGHPGAGRQRDAALLHDRGGAGGPRRLPREAPARLLALPMASVSARSAWWLAIGRRRSPRRSRRCCVGTAPRWRTARSRRARQSPRWSARSLLQVGANFANDLFDFERGADNADRARPAARDAAGLDQRRADEARHVARVRGRRRPWGCTSPGVAGWPMRRSACCRSRRRTSTPAGRCPTATSGSASSRVFVFFGVVAVAGTYFVQARRCRRSRCSASLPVGALATAILVVNNLRDIETDARAGKRTLAVRLGDGPTRSYYLLLLVVAYAVPLLLWWRGLADAWVLLPWLSLPLALQLARRMRHERGLALNGCLVRTAHLEVVFGLLFALGLAW